MAAFQGFLQLKITKNGKATDKNYDNLIGYEADNPTAFHTTKKIKLFFKNGTSTTITADKIKFIER